ncbi:hypothetical protein AMST5_01293 [freshwater sediment metagenome]|uniref:Helix-turn-helix domain-containing protein n=1 Tax=freshwater sediment metagenome TaxID=556182 RepID=A0AA48M0N1_9ZZZZ
MSTSPIGAEKPDNRHERRVQRAQEIKESEKPTGTFVRRTWNLREAAAMIGCSVATLYRWYEQDRIKLTKIGGRTYVSEEELRRITNGLAA